jgi:hypothetical protein
MISQNIILKAFNSQYNYHLLEYITQEVPERLIIRALISIKQKKNLKNIKDQPNC